ncbi:hypothetical protein V6N11_059398 [Hibiscus sabdariffa]|uniref:Uncharacterized protein n=1 Tax=Hibiscus sabdariffa TaxID=183260 RepID=A0ABR2AE87_9ROSI
MYYCDINSKNVKQTFEFNPPYYKRYLPLLCFGVRVLVDDQLWQPPLNPSIFLFGGEPFSSLLTDLENASPSDDLPEALAKKLKENHVWFVETVSRFKPPNEKSKEALTSSQQIKIGPHELTVKPDFRDKALQVSSYLCLDEVQSYILVDRYLERGNAAENYIVHDPIHVVLLQYFIERQCLFKCTRQILTHALYLGNGLKEGSLVREEAQKLIF